MLQEYVQVLVFVNYLKVRKNTSIRILLEVIKHTNLSEHLIWIKPLEKVNKQLYILNGIQSNTTKLFTLKLNYLYYYVRINHQKSQVWPSTGTQ